MEANIRKEMVDVPISITNSADNLVLVYMTDLKNKGYPQYLIFNSKEKSMTYYEIPMDDLDVPHSACRSPWGIYMFFANKPYFTHLNFTGRFDFYTGEDLGLKDAFLTSHTPTIDEDDKNYFYMSFMSKDKSMTRYYKISMDLKEVHYIAEDKIFKQPSHQVVRYGKHLMTTGFLENNFLSADGSVKSKSLYKVINDNLYKYFKKENNLENKSPEEIQSFVNSNCHIFGETFTDRTENEVIGCKYLDGDILIWNLETKKMQQLKCIGSNPSHLDKHGDDFYSVCNNILYLFTDAGKLNIFFTDTAYINKFKLIDDEFKVVDSWTHETAYRFPTHRLYFKDNNPHIIAIGFPNRIFSIDVQNMELDFYYDIGPNIVGEKENLKKFLNEFYPQGFDNPNRYSAIDVTSDSKYVILASQSHIRYFNLKHKDIEYEIPFEMPDGYCQCSLHLDNLKY